jgi:GNAT superfamily N-acetyltransferase
MASSLLARTHEIYRNNGSKDLSIRVLRRLVSPVLRVGSVYFLDRDLNTLLPPPQPVCGITIRQATANDVHLFDGMNDAHRLIAQARDRLNRGHLWFVAIEDSTRRLAHYRWVSTTTALIPELNRHIICAPQEAYFYDLYTLPEFRRRGIDGYSRQTIYEYVRRELGIRRILVYICADNHPSLQAARPYLKIIGRVWYAEIGPFEKEVFMPSSDRMPLLRQL